MEPILETKDLTKEIREKGKPAFTPVNQVSFRLEPGETLGIAGESGSGKSTLARLITRLRDATSGHILLCGQDITRAKGRQLQWAYRQMQMVFQSPRASFNPRKTVGQSIGESLMNQKIPPAQRRERVGFLLEQCGLPRPGKTATPMNSAGVSVSGRPSPGP